MATGCGVLSGRILPVYVSWGIKGVVVECVLCFHDNPMFPGPGGGASPRTAAPLLHQEPVQPAGEAVGRQEAGKQQLRRRPGAGVARLQTGT